MAAYLKINGINAKEHPVFRELERVKQYFAKVKEAEEKVSGAKPSTTLNKQAAARIIQHSLVGERGKVSAHSDGGQAANATSDMTQRERELRERLLAKRKQKTNTSPAPVLATTNPPAAEVQADEVLESISKEIEMLNREGSEEGEIGEEPEVLQESADTSSLNTGSKQPSAKKRKHNDSQSSKLSTGQKADKKARKKAKKAAKAANADSGIAV